jgi:uncharacterized protein YhfF
MPFFSITAEHAKMEGQGDGGLADWQRVYWEFFQRELKEFERKPNESMIIVCEYFEKVF